MYKGATQVKTNREGKQDSKCGGESNMKEEEKERDGVERTIERGWRWAEK